MAKVPLGDRELKIGILGMTEGNGHPYSWSAMFNGYDPEEMAKCPFPVIPAYLSNQPEKTFGMPGRAYHTYMLHRIRGARGGGKYRARRENPECA